MELSNGPQKINSLALTELKPWYISVGWFKERKDAVLILKLQILTIFWIS